MLLFDAINSVDMSPKNTFVCSSKLFKETLGLSIRIDEKKFKTKIKQHYLAKWIDGDFRVFSNDMFPFAFCYQFDKKERPILQFISKQVGEYFRDWLLTLAIFDHDIPVIDLEEEIGEGYIVKYRKELLTTRGFYNGQQVKIVDNHIGDSSCDWVRIRFANGETRRIDLDDFKIPFLLKK